MFAIFCLALVAAVPHHSKAKVVEAEDSSDDNSAPPRKLQISLHRADISSVLASKGPAKPSHDDDDE